MPRLINANPLNFTQGHPPWPRVPPAIAHTVNVTVEDFNPMVVGDQFALHVLPLPSHPVVVIFGSPDIFIGNLPVLRDGDPLSCGDVANSAFGSVFCNGRGSIGINQADPDNTIGFSLGLPVITYPSLEFKYTGIRDQDGVLIDIRGVFTSFSPEIYTPMRSEIGPLTYRNYPGMPYSVFGGGVNLPAYAPQYARDPITITNFSVEVSNYRNGISIDSSTGVISGRVASFEDIFINNFLKVRISTRFGSNPTPINSWITFPIKFTEV